MASNFSPFIAQSGCLGLTYGFKALALGGFRLRSARKALVGWICLLCGEAGGCARKFQQ